MTEINLWQYEYHAIVVMWEWLLEIEFNGTKWSYILFEGLG